MIKTFRLAGYELRRFKGPLPILGLLFLLLIPTLVGALYLWSNWDPYGKTDQVPVAVVNEDVSVEVEGKTIDAGDRLVTELRSNPIFDWQFVDRDQAEAGLSEGSYYMIVSIPADFSENLISGSGANPDRAVVDIVLNDSNNYLMELLAASAQNELEAAIDRAAVGAYFESVFANLDTIRTDVLAASSNASQLAATSNVALSGMTELSTAVSTSKQSSSQLVSGLADSKASSTQLVTGLAGAKSESTALAAWSVHPGVDAPPSWPLGRGRVASGSQSIGQQRSALRSAPSTPPTPPVRRHEVVGNERSELLSDNIDVIGPAICAGRTASDGDPAVSTRKNAAANG